MLLNITTLHLMQFLFVYDMISVKLKVSFKDFRKIVLLTNTNMENMQQLKFK